MEAWFTFGVYMHKASLPDNRVWGICLVVVGRDFKSQYCRYTKGPSNFSALKTMYIHLVS